jgi:hypothetical protein
MDPYLSLYQGEFIPTRLWSDFKGASKSLESQTDGFA